MANWKEFMIDRRMSFAELVDGGHLEVGVGRPRSVDLDRYPMAILKVADVLDGKVQHSYPERTPAEPCVEMGAKVSRPGDVVLTVKGSVGRSAIIPSEGPCFAYSPQICYFRLSGDNFLHFRYLYYWLKSPEFWVQCNSLKGQTDMADFLGLGDILSLKIHVPSFACQEGVSGLLGALDDKIAVNDRIADVTDRLVAAMFSVLLAECPALERVRLGDIAEVNSRSVKPEERGSLRYVDISSVGVGSYEWPQKIQWCDAPGRARRLAPAGSTVWSTVRPNRRSHALVLDADADLVFSTGLAVLTPTSVGPAFLYEATRMPEFQSYLESVAEGSTYPAVRAERFKQAPVWLPEAGQRDRFEGAAIALRNRSHQAAVESRTLAALRDTLLPQLMSGRLRVKDAEKIVEEHT